MLMLKKIIIAAALLWPAIAHAQAVIPASTPALASSLIVKASAGVLYGFEVAADSTLSSAPWFVMVFDSATVPADGAVQPSKCFAMPSGAPGFATIFTLPISLIAGITIVTSSTGCFTLTASPHAYLSGDAQ
jgi:hypothetical protein